MGYYSDVRFNTTKEGYERFKNMLNEGAKSWMFGSCDTPEVFDECDGEVIFGWDNIKWYGEFPEVRSVMQVYHALRDDSVPFEYVRIGEEFGDFDYDEDEHEWWEPPRLMRHIEPYMTINVW